MAGPASATNSEIRVCKACAKQLPATDRYFYREGKRKYLGHRCKECVVKINGSWRRKNRRPDTPARDRACERCKRRFVGSYQRRCPECCAARVEWNQLREFREKARFLGGTAKTRSRRQNVRYQLTHEQITRLLAKTSHCPICKVKLVFDHHGTGFHRASPSIDRMIPADGYTIGNIAVICTRCNILKRDATADELEAIAVWMRRSLATADKPLAPPVLGVAS